MIIILNNENINNSQNLYQFVKKDLNYKIKNLK